MFKPVKASFFVLATISLLLSACADQESYPTVNAQTSQYRLGTGDKLRIIVANDDDLSGEYKIDDAGKISIPTVGLVTATGLTSNELESGLQNYLSQNYLVDPIVNVEILNYKDIYILGEVSKPGNYAFFPKMTGLQAIAVAGGYTERADESKLELRRINGDEITSRDMAVTNFLQPGDTLIVKRRWF